MPIEIQEMDGVPLFCRYYIFDDVAELFWRDDYSKSNHDAEEIVRKRIVAKGGAVEAEGIMSTPAGTVGFDSESGAFECHAALREAVEYVAEIIEELQAEFDRHREALS